MCEDINPINLLVLSDIHFGISSSSKDFALKSTPPQHLISNAVPMIDSLVASVKGRHFDSILVTGDLTSTGGPSEFKECLDSITNIAAKVGVNKENIFYAFGNHDVNWHISKLADENINNFKDDQYCYVAATVGNIYVKNSKEKEEGPIPGSGIYCRDKYIIYMVNTGYYSDHKQEYPHGKLGSNQLEWLKNCIAKYHDQSKWHILMLHHHPFKYSFPTIVQDISCLEEGAELLDLIGISQIDLVCHGHRHHPKYFTQMQSNWSSPITFFCAGSLAVNEQHRHLGMIPNLFHIINLEKRSNKNAATGIIESFEYSTIKGWSPVVFSDYVPLDPVQAFGSIDIEKDIIQEATNVIEDTLSQGTGNCITLPKHSKLPLSLKCMCLNDLNTLIKKIVNEKYGFKLIGKYTDEVVITR